MRKKGSVPFPNNTWLKRYHDQEKWHSIRESQAISIIKESYKNDYDRIIYNVKEGSMEFKNKYCALIYIKDSLFQDELPYNPNFNDYIYNQ